MALLHYLFCLSSKENFTIVVINIEHGIRGEESLKDTEFVKAHCKAKGIEYIGSSVDAPAYAERRGLTIEQAARELRYSIFDKLIEEQVVSKIALAHHLDDQCETILMRIFRGTGINGLTGIASVRGNYIRPFLKVTREEIDRYIMQNNIEYREDMTNSQNDYARNFIRNEILAKLKERYPSYPLAIERLARLSTEQIELLDELCPRPLLFADEARLIISVIKDNPKALIKRSFYHAMRHLGSEVDFEEINFEDVLSLVDKDNGSMVNLARGVVACREYEFITFAKNYTSVTINMPFEVKEHILDDRRIVVRPYLSGDRLRFDLDKIPSSARIRTRQSGDVFTKFGGGTKTLGDYFTDKKVPKRIRDSIALIADGNEILAIVGIEISERIAVSDTTEKIYTILEDKISATI